MTPEKGPDELHESNSSDLTPKQRARVAHYREGIYPVLSEEAKPRLAQEMKKWSEQGLYQPTLEPSFLGLGSDWLAFETRKFPEHACQTSFMNPPEFIFYGFSALDAYATAILAANLSFSSLGALNFTSKLIRRDSDGKMHLEFATTPERGRIDSGSVRLELLHLFPELLKTKGLKESFVLFLEGEGCPMDWEYPGRMVAKESPFLRDRPVELWPQITLSLTPTTELRRRARDLLEFLRSPLSNRDSPN